MKIVKEYPPNYEKICQAIPGVRGQDSIIFTYGDTVYAPGGTDLPDHLQRHESIHVGQQKQIGEDAWWEKYLTDVEFRLQQELQAYRAQYKMVSKQKNWRHTEDVLSTTSRDLSGAMYGNIITKEEARALITKVK